MSSRARIRLISLLCLIWLLTFFLPPGFYQGCRFKSGKQPSQGIDLAPEIQQRILKYQFIVNILPSHVENTHVIQIFRRMNSTNFPLNSQEIRISNFYRRFKTMIYRLAKEKLLQWRRWKLVTASAIARMAEVELASELVIMIINGEIQVKSRALIDKSYSKYDMKFPRQEEIQARFCVWLPTLRNA